MQRSLNVEEREIQLRYQDLKTYAVGHGAATNWQKNQQGDMEIWADFMPQVEVPQVIADTGGNNNKVLVFDFFTTRPQCYCFFLNFRFNNISAS